MSDQSELNGRGNHNGEFSQGVGGWAEYSVHLTETSDKVRHDVKLPPRKVIPIIFLPGVMGSNLRLSKTRQTALARPDNRSWKPDDMVGVANGLTIATVDADLGGWYKNASPAQRQLMLDPNETEVEYYNYTENKGRFDPDGRETLEADKRHQNIPDSFGPIRPLIGQSLLMGQPSGRRPKSTLRESPAQIVRWRGWSEVLFSGAYGQVLMTAESHLNNMFINGRVNPSWNQVFAEPSTFGAIGFNTMITEKDLRAIADCWYPVHAMGYNYLKSNGVSARVIADRIRGLTTGYQKRGFQCNEVIIVTHSMGGLVARALIHPKYGNMLNDPSVKILGMYHNVMPTMGAAASYKRTRFGFMEGSGEIAEIKARIVSIDGKNATAILANAPGALELFPGRAYGTAWLKVVDRSGREMWSLPSDGGHPSDSIYTQSVDKWWRLMNPDWINPGLVKKINGGGMDAVIQRLKNSADFIENIKTTFHPVNCYASFCSSSERASYGEVVFKVSNFEIGNIPNNKLPPVESWTLLSDDAKGVLKVQAGKLVLTLTLQPPAVPGDETVPADRSAKKIVGNLFVHGKNKGKSYEHQNSYAHGDVLVSLLYSVVQIAKTANWA